MPRVTTTVGRLMVSDALPEDLRDPERVLDRKGLLALLKEVAQKYPGRYREISHRLAEIGHHAAQTTGGHSFGLRHLRQTPGAIEARRQLQRELDAIDDDDNLTDEQREQKVLKAVGRLAGRQSKDILQEALDAGNPLARQVTSGAKGSEMNLASLLGSDLLYTDHRDRTIPLPVMRSFGQGLSPVEYWAGAYGARKGTIDLKMATPDAGFLEKQMDQVAHRLLVTGLDASKPPATPRGLPADTDDPDNEGALLAMDTGGYARNTVLTPKILADLKRHGIKRILARSPIAGTASDGVHARDVGVREFSRLPVRGESVGMTAGQALGEPLAQGAISSKHTGGVAGAHAAKAVGGFQAINQLFQVPKTFKGGAAHAQLDGTVQTIEEAPAGGQFVTIDGQQHYVAKGFELKVKRGDKVEAGDVISDGLPNPAVIVRHKGVGEGRRYFTYAFRQAFRDANLKADRRNVELIARGLIDHVRLTDEVGDFAPDDVVPYSLLERRWRPRADARELPASEAVGKHLEQPYLHYSIGTKVRPSMLTDFKDFGVKQLLVHDQPPPFEPEMVRGMANLSHDPDWMVQMYGSGLKSSLLESARRGARSDETGTSFVPALARGTDFGRIGQVVTPKPPEQEQRR